MRQVSIFGILFVLLVIYLITKTKTGYDVVFYALALILLLLTLGHYKDLQNLMFEHSN